MIEYFIHPSVTNLAFLVATHLGSDATLVSIISLKVELPLPITLWTTLVCPGQPSPYTV